MIKQDDKVMTPQGVGVVKRIYYGKDSCKPYKAQVLVGNEILECFICDMEVIK